MSEMTTKLKNIERFEDLELGSIRILNSAIAYLTHLESENAALKSRLEEATKELKGADKVINEQWATGIAVEAENVELKSRLEEAERIVKVVSDGGCLVCLEGGVGCNVHEGNDCIRRLVKQWRRGAQVDGGGK